MAKYKAPSPEPEAPKRKTVVPGWARKYQREQAVPLEDFGVVEMRVTKDEVTIVGTDGQITVTVTTPLKEREQ